MIKRGGRFEQRIINDCGILRIKCFKFNEARMIGKNRFILVRQPFDFIAFYTGKAICFDAKEFANDKFYFKSNIFSNRKAHQIDNLKAVADYGHVCGFLLRIVAHRRTYWIPVEQLMAWWFNGDKYPIYKDIEHSWSDQEVINLSIVK